MTSFRSCILLVRQSASPRLWLRSSSISVPLFEPECGLVLSLSQHSSDAGEFPVACSHVADAIGSASAVERIKRRREIRTVAVLDRRKRSGRGLIAAHGAEALRLPAM